MPGNSCTPTKMEEEKLGGVGRLLVGLKHHVEPRRASSRVCESVDLVLVVLAPLLFFSVGTRVSVAQGSGVSFRNVRGWCWRSPEARWGQIVTCEVAVLEVLPVTQLKKLLVSDGPHRMDFTQSQNGLDSLATPGGEIIF